MIGRIAEQDYAQRVRGFLLLVSGKGPSGDVPLKTIRKSGNIQDLLIDTEAIIKQSPYMCRKCGVYGFFVEDRRDIHEVNCDG